MHTPAVPTIYTYWSTVQYNVIVPRLIAPPISYATCVHTQYTSTGTYINNHSRHTVQCVEED